MTIRILGHDSALSRQLDQLCQRIAALDRYKEGPTVLAQVRSARPDFTAKFELALQAHKVSARESELALNALGSTIVSMVQEMPAQIEAIIALIDDRSTTAALRCALVSALAYIAQPRDLVPDDAPGGYGLIDDAALLAACLLQVTPATPENAAMIEDLKKRLAGMESMLPGSAGAGLQQAVQGLVLIVQSMGMLPAQIADATTRILLDNPGISEAPQAPTGWHPPSFQPPGAGHWSGGAYFEGGNVVVPNGPSLIGGRLYVPD